MFFVSIVGVLISLRTKIYKRKVSKEEGIASYIMRVSQIRDQLQELGEIMPDKKITTIVLNALPEEWGNFTSSIFGKKEATPFSELWSLCRIEETGLKAKNDVGSIEQVQAFASMARKKGKFGPQKKNKNNMSKIQCYGCHEYGHYKRDCPKLKEDNNKRGREEAHITEEV